MSSRNLAAIAIIVALGLLPGCVELTGQRITLRYDAKTDCLQLLLAYHGVHEALDGEGDDGKKQIKEFVKDGDVMLLDWWGKLSRKDIAKEAAKKSGPPALQALSRHLNDSLHTRIIGHFRDPNGHLGALQLVTIKEARLFIRRINGALNEWLLSASEKERLGKSMPRMHALLAARARKDEQWIALDGHSLVATIPIHFEEWSRAKAGMVASFAKEYRKMFGEDKDKNQLRPETMLALLATAGTRISETETSVTASIGRRSQPHTFRFRLRDRYETSLEEIVRQHVPQSLDDALFNLLMKKGTAADAAPTDLVEWLPPEDKVRAALAQVTGSGAHRAAATNWLAAFSKSWNQETGCPRAPKGATSATPEAWKSWYSEMLSFPLPNAVNLRAAANDKR